MLIFEMSTQVDAGKNWAFLIAGSNGYTNYRHQADICHAYHVVRNHGIPAEQIIVMMYDDIANNTENPIKGNIINEPNGPNVYNGVVNDYSGNDVNPDVFLKVLSGDSKGVEKLTGRKGRVIESGPNDRVFVNFADHGAPGVIAFPDDYLAADDLNNVLVKMYDNKQYKELVLYIEACESGSMFNKILRDDINVFATTAANTNESSYACYYDNFRNTYLGDVYSVNWMQDSDVDDLKQETLQKQFNLVKKETNTSHVMEYGDKSIGNMIVADFQGNLTDTTLRFHSKKRVNPNIDAVPSEDVALEILKQKNDHEGVKKLIEKRDSTRKFFHEMVISVSSFDYWSLHKMPVDFSDFTCYKTAMTRITMACPGMNLIKNDYALRSLRVLANLCEKDIPLEEILKTIDAISKITPLCASKLN